jgi:hypothetical protein
LQPNLLVVASADCKLAVRRFERLVRHDARVRVAKALRFLTCSQPVRRDVGEGEHLSLEQRRLDVLTKTLGPAAASVLQGGAPAVARR